MEGRLTTLLLADVCNFTSLCESGTRAELVAVLEEVIQLIVDGAEVSGGTPLKFLGDAVVLEFAAPSLALQSARSIHHAARERNRRRENLIKVQVRISVALAELYEDEHYQFGPALDLVMGIEKEAGPGQTVVTESCSRAASVDASELFSLGSKLIEGRSTPVEMYLYESAHESGALRPASQARRAVAGVLDIWIAVLLLVLFSVMLRIPELYAGWQDRVQLDASMFSFAFEQEHLSWWGAGFRTETLGAGTRGEVEFGGESGKYYLTLSYDLHGRHIPEVVARVQVGENSFDVVDAFPRFGPRITRYGPIDLTQGDSVAFLVARDLGSEGGVEFGSVALTPVWSNAYSQTGTAAISGAALVRYFIGVRSDFILLFLLQGFLVTGGVTWLSLFLFLTTPGSAIMRQRIAPGLHGGGVRFKIALVRTLALLTVPVWFLGLNRGTTLWFDRLSRSRVVVCDRSRA